MHPFIHASLSLFIIEQSIEASIKYPPIYQSTPLELDNHLIFANVTFIISIVYRENVLFIHSLQATTFIHYIHYKNCHVLLNQ